jgi:hypothetical protein
MSRRSLLILFCIALLAVSAFAGEIREIELSDGSVIAGEVLSLADGIYTVRSLSLGTFTIEESRVRTIRSRGSASSSGPAAPDADPRSLHQRMMSDQQIMGMIESLKDDPQFRKALEDPGIMNAVNSGDIATLMANPKFLQLLQNPAVKDIQQLMTK